MGVLLASPSKMSCDQALANWLYDHPFMFVAGVGAATVTSIFAMEKIRHPTLSLSSRVMHTRVYSQGIIVTLLCGTMVFHDYMKRQGRFGGERNMDE